MPSLNVPIGPNPPHVVNIIVEIPRGSSNKYEIDRETGMVSLDRVLFSPMFYPGDYGFIPQTLYSDGDPLDALVMLTHPTFPGCIVEARPIGVLGMRDEKGRDDKIICVAMRDPRFAEVNSPEELGDHFRREIVHFFQVYKQLENKTVEILGWESSAIAKDMILDYRIDR